MRKLLIHYSRRTYNPSILKGSRRTRSSRPNWATEQTHDINKHLVCTFNPSTHEADRQTSESSRSAEATVKLSIKKQKEKKKAAGKGRDDTKPLSSRKINTKQKANGFAYKKQDLHKFYLLCLFVEVKDQAQDFLHDCH